MHKLNKSTSEIPLFTHTSVSVAEMPFESFFPQRLNRVATENCGRENADCRISLMQFCQKFLVS